MGVDDMTVSQFHQECLARLIDTGVALENETLRDALKRRDDDEVMRILDEEF